MKVKIMILTAILFCLSLTGCANSDIGENSADHHTTTTATATQTTIATVKTTQVTVTEQATSTANDEKPTTTTTKATTTTTQKPEVETPPANEKMVWIPATGSKYHSKSGCSGMKEPRQVSLSEALNMDYGPCKKCYG